MFKKKCFKSQPGQINFSLIVSVYIYFMCVCFYCFSVDKFNVGKNLEIAMQIRPRSQEGVLLAVYGSGNDFLLLQISEGNVSYLISL